MAVPMQASVSPADAQQQLLSMMRPEPTVPPTGARQQAMEPANATMGGTTPSTNPIGLMAGLGKDPGGSSVMGNAAFGTRNNAVKISRLQPLAVRAERRHGSGSRQTARLARGYGHAHQQGTVQREGLEPGTRPRCHAGPSRCRLRPEQLDPYA